MATAATSSRLSRGVAATLACIWEATAAKPGNVHPDADFDDVTYGDFLRSAVVIGPVLERTQDAGVGRTILEAVRVTQKAVGTNTNLGTLLLLAPLAAVPDGDPHRTAIGAILSGLSHDDTRYVYEAIRVSGAGGLGEASEADVFRDAPTDLQLVNAMQLVADMDLVARQYTNNFADVLFNTAEWIAEGVARQWSLTEAIVHTHLRQLARHGDSLIVRKCGQQTSDEARDRAANVLAAGAPGEDRYSRAVADYDTWLRADGHRRNPGTSADLIAAGLYVLLREGRVELKLMYQSQGPFASLAGG